MNPVNLPHQCASCGYDIQWYQPRAVAQSPSEPHRIHHPTCPQPIVPMPARWVIESQAQQRLAYAERMRDQYRGRDGVYAKLHADWCAYIDELRARWPELAAT